MNIQLSVDGPLDVAATLARYRLWGEDPANRVVDDTFLRVARIDGRVQPYAVRWRGGVDDVKLSVSVPGARAAAAQTVVTAEVRKIFGLDFDVPAFYRMAKADRALAEIVEALYGLRPTLTPNPLEMLVGSITAQQVNLTFAFALRGRLVRRYGTPVDIAGETVHAFPEAPVLAAADMTALRAMQFSQRKAEYIRDVARAVVGGLDLDVLAVAAADTTVIERLTALRGLGRWTADWFLARCAGRGDVCPAGDLAVRKAFDHYYGRGRALSEAAIRRRAARWGPHQNLAIHYLLADMRRRRAAAGGGT
jgi:DNA-3-methyladenine glycosylase II